MEDKNIRFIRLNEVRQITGLSRSSIYQFIAEGKFPSQVRIGTRAVAWLPVRYMNGANIRFGSCTQQYQIQNDNHFVQVNLNE